MGRRNRLPTEPGSYSETAENVGDNAVPNSNSPIKSPPYSSAESDDNSLKGNGKDNLNLTMCHYKNFLKFIFKF